MIVTKEMLKAVSDNVYKIPSSKTRYKLKAGCKYANHFNFSYQIWMTSLKTNDEILEKGILEGES